MSLSLFRKGLLIVAVAGLLASVGAYAGTRGGSGAREKAPPQRPAPAPSQPAGPVSVASGSAQRSFVSANHGNDANPCTVTLPCRNFAAAIAQTVAGGEVIVLDSGGYGPVTIGQSVSIIAPAGIYAGITATSGNAIIQTCGAGTAYDTVVYVRAADCTSGVEIACNDDACTNATGLFRASRVAPAVTAGTTYFIVVDGFGGSSGSFTLSVTPP